MNFLLEHMDHVQHGFSFWPETLRRGIFILSEGWRTHPTLHLGRGLEQTHTAILSIRNTFPPAFFTDKATLQYFCSTAAIYGSHIYPGSSVS